MKNNKTAARVIAVTTKSFSTAIQENVAKPNKHYCDGMQPAWPTAFNTELNHASPVKNGDYRVTWNGKIRTYQREATRTRARMVGIKVAPMSMVGF